MSSELVEQESATTFHAIQQRTNDVLYCTLILYAVVADTIGSHETLSVKWKQSNGTTTGCCAIPCALMMPSSLMLSFSADKIRMNSDKMKTAKKVC